LRERLCVRRDLHRGRARAALGGSGGLSRDLRCCHAAQCAQRLSVQC
jgi:hypothetical protein